MYAGMRMHVRGQRLSLSIASSPYFFGGREVQDFSLSSGLTILARLTDQELQGSAYLYLPCAGLQMRAATVTYAGAGDSKLRSSRLCGMHFTHQPSPQHLTAGKYQETLTRCISPLLMVLCMSV